MEAHARIPEMRDYANLNEVITHLLAAGVDPAEVNRIAGDLTDGALSLRSQWVIRTHATVFPL